MADTGVKSGLGCCVCFLEGFSSRGSGEAFKLQVAVHAAFLEQVVSAFFFQRLDTERSHFLKIPISLVSRAFWKEEHSPLEV